jgi:hypothetical protein
MIVYAGRSFWETDDTWALNLENDPEWVEIQPGGTIPPERSAHTTILDTHNYRMVIFGGRFLRNDTWALTVPFADAVLEPEWDANLFLRVAPNPARAWSRIELQIPAPCRAVVTVYDAEGALIKRLLRGPVSTGTRTLLWDTTDQHGRPVSAGVYFVKIDLGGSAQQRSLVLLR